MNTKNKIQESSYELLNQQMGAIVENDTSVSFRIWVPNAIEVFVQCKSIDSKPPGLAYSNNDLKKKVIDNFLSRIYNQNAKFPKIYQKIEQNNWHFIFGDNHNLLKLKRFNSDVFFFNSKSAHNINIKPGYLYRFLVRFDEYTDLIPLKDPYSNFQPFDTDGWSQIIDHNQFEWEDKNYIQDIQNCENNLQSKIILETHIGTFTKNGNFISASLKIPTISDDCIFDTIEILPIADFYGKINWGYDGLDLFAPDSTYCKHPDDLKNFVNIAHIHGLKVILDVVYNHYGPDYSISEYINEYNSKNSSPWGNAPNLDSFMVKKYILDNLFYWIEKYHINGFRLDATYAIDRKNSLKNDMFLKEIAINVKKKYPGILLIAEDIRNAPRVTTTLTNNDFERDNFIKDMSYSFFKKKKPKEAILNNLGYDAQWNVDFTKSVEAFLTGNQKSYSLGADGFYLNDINEIIKLLKFGTIRPINLNEIENNQVKYNPKTNINYISCHDSIGNYNGTRLLLKIIQSKLLMTNKVIIDKVKLYKLLKKSTHQNKNKKYVTNLIKKREHQLLSKLILILVNTYFHYKSKEKPISKELWETIKLNASYDLRKEISISENNALEDQVITFENLTLIEFENALEDAISLNKLAFLLLFISEGRKMIFMGDEEGIISPLKYFRDFPTEYLEEKIMMPEDKGYNINYNAFIESKITEQSFKIQDIKSFLISLIKIYRNNKVLEEGCIDETILASYIVNNIKNIPLDKILLVRKKYEEHYMYFIINFSNVDINTSISLKNQDFFINIAKSHECIYSSGSFKFEVEADELIIKCSKYGCGIISATL